MKASLQRDIDELIQGGIFSHKELAKALSIPVDKVETVFDDEVKNFIEKRIVENKASLVNRMFTFADEGCDEVDGVKMGATKFLLAILHGMHEKHILERETLLLKKQTAKMQQIIAAAERAMQWDQAFTDKFLENVSKVWENV